ncbi:hypothetical protein BDN70DRAFT_873970 [Pholiota conissans]|uniref:Uncharacterized protein n=1 Tax=Pholiota conissans TaxID=109636 RepID=A0A9P6D497_9AGAR|nr:hypothetical protein BDN70DRAFT_873970 [Pholiota conissans]
MKSTHKPVPRREALLNYVRAKSHREGTTFSQAVQNVVFNENGRGDYIPNLYPRPAKSKWDWRGGRHSERNVKTPPFEQPAPSAVEGDEQIYEAPAAPRHTDMTVSLLNIARPAKGKRVARDFEVVRSVRNVIVLAEENEDTFFVNDDGWERIYDEESVDYRKSYSSVLRGNGHNRAR